MPEFCLSQFLGELEPNFLLYKDGNGAVMLHTTCPKCKEYVLKDAHGFAVGSNERYHQLFFFVICQHCGKWVFVPINDSTFLRYRELIKIVEVRPFRRSL